MRNFLLAAVVVFLTVTFHPTLSRADDDGQSAGSSSTAQTNDEPVGRVEDPDNVRNAPSNEGASERAGAGFDTPWTPEPYNDGKADNLEPKPFSATPNN